MSTNSVARIYDSPELKTRLKREYEEAKSVYEKLVDEVIYILNELMKDKVKLHSVTCREGKIKSFDSFYDKVLRKNITDHQLDVVEDIAGVRMICLYRSDLEVIGKLLTEGFRVVASDTFRTRTETPFGYASDHYVIRLSEECKGARYNNIKNLNCEIQVRTLLMDAWASVSHHLDYKQEIDIPMALKTDFNSLAGLFYVADTHFEFFRKGVEEARTKIIKQIEKGTFDLGQEITFDGLKAYLENVFPDPIHSDSDFSYLLKELKTFDYKTIRQLDEKIKQVLPIFSDFEKEYWASIGDPKGRWSISGVVRAILDLTDKAYLKSRIRWLCRLKGWETQQKYKAMLKDK